MQALVYPGTLSYPSDVESTLSVPADAGPVSVFASWPTTTSLSVEVRCGSTREAFAAANTSVELHSNGGACSIAVALPSGSTTPRLSYRLVVRSLHKVLEP